VNPFKRLVRWASGWAWAEELDEGEHAIEHFTSNRQIAVLKSLQLGLLEDLFREKQGKITRLQQCYTEKKRPLYEDLRKENPIKDAESLAQSISALAQRAEAHRARTGKPMRISDGTVQGVPGDQPNVETGDGW
jgi:hypothetical protein